MNYSRKLLITSTALALTAGVGSSIATAQSVDIAALEMHLQAANSPLLFATTYGELQSVQNGAATKVTLYDVSIADQELDTLGFTLTPSQTPGLVTVSDLELPAKISFDLLGETGELSWQSLLLAGEYDIGAGAYQALNLSMSDAAFAVEELGLAYALGAMEIAATFADGTLTTALEVEDLSYLIDDPSLTMSAVVPLISSTSVAEGYTENPLARPLFAFAGPINSGSFVHDNMDENLALPATSLGEGTFSDMTISVNGIDAADVTIGGGTFTQTLADAHIPGAASLNLSMALGSISFTESASFSTFETGPVTFAMNMRDGDLTDPSALAALELSSDLPGTYAGFADLLTALGAFDFGMTFTDMSFTAPFDGIDMSASEMSMGMGFSAVPATGGLGLSMSLRDVDLGDVAGPFLTSLLPGEAEISVSLDAIDIDSLMEVFRQANRTGSIDDPLAFNRDMDAMFPALDAWWRATKSVLTPTIQYTSPALSMSLDGALNMAPATAYGLAGTALLEVTDYSALEANIDAGTGSPDLADQQIATSLQQILFFASLFGEITDQDTLRFDLVIEDDGTILSNGVPLPF